MDNIVQKMFDEVGTHLLTQRKRSVNVQGSCLYRGPEGTKCAIGVIIPDDKYKWGMEGMTAIQVQREGTLWLKDEYVHPDITDYMLRELQHIHDACEVETWRGELFVFAKEHNLSTENLPNA